MIICPLCGGEGHPYHRDTRRDYYECETCSLVFVDARQLLSAEDEKAQYDLHRNDVRDPVYRNFLSRLFDPLNQRLDEGSKGLDFGCGSGPALAAMFREAGHRMNVYDVFYAPDKAALVGPYDFIAATEVIEHLHHPRQEIERLWDILKPGGTLGLMTKLVINHRTFTTWHYKNDPTHVIFFSKDTFKALAYHLGAELEFIGQDVILLRKPNEEPNG